MQTQFRHYGMCDASAAIALDSETFAVANDEDNFIKIYHARASGKFIAAIDISGYLNGSGSAREADIEAAAALDGVIFWITSHGRNRKAKRQESRYHFFANRMRHSGERVEHEQVGRSCTRLIEDMLANKRLRKFDLKAAAKMSPKEKGGLNIEGLAATPEGELLIGFRNPIVKKRALLLPLLNPFAVLQGDAAQFGDAIELDLDGLGVRSIDYWRERDQYVIAAGAYHSGGEFRLYTWSGDPDAKPVWQHKVDFQGLHPESIVLYPGEAEYLQVLSDDGGAERGDKKCKKLPDDDARKYFRSVWIRI